MDSNCLGVPEFVPVTADEIARVILQRVGASFTHDVEEECGRLVQWYANQCAQCARDRLMSDMSRHP